jgi:hypothetical protein
MRPAARDRDSNWRSCLLLWGFAAMVRLLYIAMARPEFAIYYWDASTSLLDDGSLSSGGVRTAFLEPLYPLFLGAMRWLFGDRPLLVQSAQALIAAAGAVWLYLLTLALTGKNRPALASAALFAVYPLLVRHAVDGTESALLTTLLIAFAYQFVTMRSNGGAAAAGAWLGLAILTRAIVLPLVVAAPLVSAFRKGRTGRGLVVAVAALLVVAPAGFRNYTLNSTVLPSRSGVNLFQANCEYASSVVAEYGPDILLAYAESRLAEEGLLDLPDTPESEQLQDAAYRRLALAEIRQHPGDTLRLKIRNLYDLFSPTLVPRRQSTEATTIVLLESGQAIVEHTLERPLLHRVAYSTSYSAVLVLATAGLFARRRGLSDDAILWCILLTFVAVYVVFTPTTRYRAPVDFVLLFYAAIGLDWAIETWRRSAWLRGVRSSATAP